MANYATLRIVSVQGRRRRAKVRDVNPSHEHCKTYDPTQATPKQDATHVQLGAKFGMKMTMHARKGHRRPWLGLGVTVSVRVLVLNCNWYSYLSCAVGLRQAGPHKRRVSGWQQPGDTSSEFQSSQHLSSWRAADGNHVGLPADSRTGVGRFLHLPPPVPRTFTWVVLCCACRGGAGGACTGRTAGTVGPLVVLLFLCSKQICPTTAFCVNDQFQIQPTAEILHGVVEPDC